MFTVFITTSNFYQLIVSNSFAHGTPLVSVFYFTGAARRVRASRACMGTPGRPAAPRYRARANGIHYGTHSVPRLQLMGHIRFHRSEAPTSVNNYYSHYASEIVAIYRDLYRARVQVNVISPRSRCDLFFNIISWYWWHLTWESIMHRYIREAPSMYFFLTARQFHPTLK